MKSDKGLNNKVREINLCCIGSRVDLTPVLKKTPSSAEGLDLGVDFMVGRTWTVGPIEKYDVSIFPKN
jgi:hypothetical protein